MKSDNTKLEYFILITGALLFLGGLGGFLASHFYEFNEQKVHQAEIGRVTHTHARVDRRYWGQLAWGPVNDRTILYEGDSIFVGSRSRATLELKTGDSIELFENSLLVLEHRKAEPTQGTIEEFRIKLIKGKTKIKRESPQELKMGLQISGKGDQIQLNKDTEITVSREGQKVDLESLSGKAIFKTKGKTEVPLEEVSSSGVVQKSLYITEKGSRWADPKKVPKSKNYEEAGKLTNIPKIKSLLTSHSRVLEEVPGKQEEEIELLPAPSIEIKDQEIQAE